MELELIVAVVAYFMIGTLISDSVLADTALGDWYVDNCFDWLRSIIPSICYSLVGILLVAIWPVVLMWLALRVSWVWARD